VDEDITVGLLQSQDPRTHCLAYRRKVDTAENMVAAKSDSVEGGGLNIGLRQEELWQKVQRCLGSEQARQYTVSSVPRRSGMTADHEVYLQKLTDDFVSDVKLLITQNLTKVQRPFAWTQLLVQEVLHHRALAKEHLGADGDEGNYSELFQRLKSYVGDPKRNRCPFVIYGRQDIKSRTMSAVAAAVSSWLSTPSPVTILRFIGTTTDSVDVQRCVASVRTQIQMSYNMAVCTARQSLYSELSTLRRVLEQVSRGHTEPLCVLLDGVDGLQPHQHALEALWTLHDLPSNIYVIMSVTSSGQQTGHVDILNALLCLITDRALQYEIRADNAHSCRQPESTHHSPSCTAALMSTLDTMEADYGPTLVKHFVVYVTIMDVGILDCELFDLLVRNDEVMGERDRVLFSPAIISILRHKLAHFLSSRLICGHVGFSWNQLEYRQAVAERYRVTVGGESTDFCVKLHQHVVEIYHEVTEKGSVLRANVSLEEELNNEDDVRTTLQSLGPENHIKASRLLHHLRIVLPTEGVSRLKSAVLFNLDWLMTRLATCPVFQLINDVLSVYRLCQDMHHQATVADSFEDIAVLLEFLQLSSNALAVNYLSLPTDVVTRLGTSFFVDKYQSVAELVSKSRHWLANTKSVALVPLWSVWDCPGGMRRHVLQGMSHVVGSVDGGHALVGYSGRGVSVWNIETGLMVHNFEVRSDQPVSGLVAASDGAFVVMSYHSDVTGMTELSVLSTETGLTLLLASFRRHFEALALSQDNQLFVVASLGRATDSDGGKELIRLIVGIHISSRDVVFQLPVVNLHSEGIIRHSLVHVMSATCLLVVCYTCRL